MNPLLSLVHIRNDATRVYEAKVNILRQWEHQLNVSMALQIHAANAALKPPTTINLSPRKEPKMADEVTQPKQYDKLIPELAYDIPASKQLAEAMNERYGLLARIQELSDIIDENAALSRYVWTTAEGVSIAHKDIEDNHLRNILTWLSTHGQSISKELKAEARTRGFAVPRIERSRSITSAGIDEAWAMMERMGLPAHAHTQDIRDLD